MSSETIFLVSKWKKGSIPEELLTRIERDIVKGRRERNTIEQYFFFAIKRAYVRKTITRTLKTTLLLINISRSADRLPFVRPSR